MVEILYKKNTMICKHPSGLVTETPTENLRWVYEYLPSQIGDFSEQKIIIQTISQRQNLL